MVLLVGSDAASRVYVANKVKACRHVGIEINGLERPENTTLEGVLSIIDDLNEDDGVHGVLVQLPLPKHIAVTEVLERIAASKDVDGFHLYNVGGLVVGKTIFPPCTPYGVQKLLEAENIPIEGQNVVVVGASNIVGKPTALMLMQGTRCNRVYLPRQNARSGSIHDPGGHPRRRRRKAQLDRRAHGQDRRSHSGRRHQQAARTADWSATWTSTRFEKKRPISRRYPAASVP